MSEQTTVTVTLTVDEVAALMSALEEAEYWAKGTHGDPGLPVDNGYVWLPGDYDGEEDPHWPEPPTVEEEEAISEVRAMRALGVRLHQAVLDARNADRLLEVARGRGSELLGHVAVALLDRGTATVDQLVAALQGLDVEAWWEAAGGPLLDGLEAEVEGV